MQPFDQIYIRIGNNTEALTARPFREGISGKKLEDALQDLLASHPNLLPGRQMDPGSADPPRFFLLRKEMPISGWALDHLFVDQYGVLTLVETKLLQNPESRRDVIGQILEYAANSQSAWASDQLRAKADEYWNGELDRNIRSTFGMDEDEDKLQEFWTNVERNLESGHFRLIVAGDELRPEVRRILEYLHREMTNVDVFGLEIRCFGDDTRLVIVPYLVGASAAAKRTSGAALKWTDAMLRDEYDRLAKKEKLVWVRLLDWAEAHAVFMESTSKVAGFGIRSSAGRRLATLSPKWTYFYLASDVFNGGLSDAEAFCDEMKDLLLIPQGVTAESAKSGKQAIRNLGDLAEPEINRVLLALERHTDSAGPTELAHAASTVG